MNHLVICIYDSSIIFHGLIISFQHGIKIHFMNVPQFVYSLTEGLLGCFQVLVIVNKAAINIHMQVFVRYTHYPDRKINLKITTHLKLKNYAKHKVLLIHWAMCSVVSDSATPWTVAH